MLTNYREIKIKLSFVYHLFCIMIDQHKDMILQLFPSILVETPLGSGQALFIIDYGMHQNTCWVIALVKDGTIKHFDCNDVILSTNYTYGLNLMKNKKS